MIFASTASLDTTLYRQLLRLGRALDRNAVARAMLVAAPEQLFDRQTQAVISLPQLDDANAEAIEHTQCRKADCDEGEGA